MQCTNSHWLDKERIRVPCGVCRACRIRRATEWTIRITHELADVYQHRGSFLTLTYNDDSVPLNYKPLDRPDREKLNYSLNGKHLQKFFKLLRTNMKRNNDETKIKYYACGEYGEETFRPHYHAIVLGLNYLNPIHRDLVYQSWPHCDWTPLRKQKSVGFASVDSIRYTCDYIQKSYLSYDRAEVENHYYGRERPFNRMSQGIGLHTCLNEEDNILKTGKINWKGNEVSLPRYYSKKVEVPEDIKNKNRQEMKEAFREKYPDTPFDFDPEVNSIDNKFLAENVQEINKQTAKNLDRKKELYKKDNLY